jgi:hypothetical protein
MGKSFRCADKKKQRSEDVMSQRREDPSLPFGSVDPTKQIQIHNSLGSSA